MEDHPRVCGEQFFLNGVFQKMKGSPPRVRGTADAPRRRNVDEGITPACAGNRLRRIVPHKGNKDHPRVCGEQTVDGISYTALKDHPRVCGEQTSPSPTPPALQGSPPRVRGTEFSLACLPV